MTAADFTYRHTSDGFVTVFPENPQAEDLYNENAKFGWSGKMLPVEFEAFKRDIRGTGWTLRKAKLTKVDYAKLVAELGL
jgi:hypothetical protein